MTVKVNSIFQRRLIPPTPFEVASDPLTSADRGDAGRSLPAMVPAATMLAGSGARVARPELRPIAACGHLSCPEYRCFYDGLCEHNWGDPGDCRLPIDENGWGNYCTFHGEIELARAAKAYGEDLKESAVPQTIKTDGSKP